MDRIAYHLPGSLNFTSCTACFYHCTVHIAIGFTPGAILPRFTVRRPIACGAADVSAAGMSARGMRWHWHRF